MGMSLSPRRSVFISLASWGGALSLCLSPRGKGSSSPSCKVCASVPLGGVCMTVVLWGRGFCETIHARKEACLPTLHKGVSPPTPGGGGRGVQWAALFSPRFPIMQGHFCVYPHGTPVTWDGSRSSTWVTLMLDSLGGGPVALMCLDEGSNSQHPPAQLPAGHCSLLTQHVPRRAPPHSPPWPSCHPQPSQPCRHDLWS